MAIELPSPLPKFVGLCPVHGQMEYMPFHAPPSRSERCPQLSCRRSLAIYERVQPEEK